MSISYNGRTIVVMPTTPAPKTVTLGNDAIVGVSTSPFTHAQQICDWGQSVATLDISLPALKGSDATPWINFLIAARGTLNVFVLPTAVQALIPTGVATNLYWCMQDDTQKYSIGEALLYGFQFVIKEVK